MQRGILLAWLAGLGIISWREISTYHKPPVPGRLLGASGWFALLALLASYQPAAGAAAAVAWGTDLAALLNLLPDVLAGTQAPAGAARTTTGTHTAPGTTTAGGRG